jgi:hypothetical protein
MNSCLLLTTPVRYLMPAVKRSLLSIAPERLNGLSTRAAGIHFVVTDDRHLGFASTYDDRKIYVSRRGLEYMWVLSYVAWVLNTHFVPGATQSPPLVFASGPDAAPIPSLLRWAVQNQFEARYTAWPAHSPRPRAPVSAPCSPPSAERVASEIALCSIAWILHHELSHIANQDVPDPVASVQQESRADSEATDWLLSQSPSGTPLIKRGLGIAVGTVALAGIALFGPTGRSSVRTHPDPATRIFTSLSHPALHAVEAPLAVAALLLKALLDATGVSTHPGPFDSASDSIADYCLTLQRHLQNRSSGAV